MTDAMVTARMIASKKISGNQVFEKLGLTPSQAINQLYDYVIAEKKLPFPEDRSQKYTVQELRDAQQRMRQLSKGFGLGTSRFSHMSDDEIRQERLITRGSATEECFR